MGLADWNFWDTAFNEYQVGNFASVIGLAVTFIGFFATLWNLARTKSAAKQAEYAAQQVRGSIEIFNSLVDVSAAIAIIDEIKRLHRAHAWHVLLDRYSLLRRMLIDIRHANLGISDEEQKSIQATIQNLRDMESGLERDLEDGKAPESMARLNGLLSERADEIHQLLLGLRSKAGR